MGIMGEDALGQLKINDVQLALKLWEENIKNTVIGRLPRVTPSTIRVYTLRMYAMEHENR